MSAHTPGPWKIDREWVYPDTHPMWRAVYIDLERCTQVSGHIGEANACLIAAAPEMLKTLRELEARLPTGYEIELRMIREAIAKAEGQS